MSLKVIVHPLVFLNISDHHTRALVTKGKPQRVIGCLFGKQTGRNLEIFNSFEINYKPSTKKPGSLEVEEIFIQQQSEMLKELFFDYEVIGWYSTSSKGEPQEFDVDIHNVIQKYNENPLYLILNPNAPPGRDIPMNLYEGNSQVIGNKPVFTFQRVPCRISSLPAEQVAVETVAKSHEAEAGSSKFVLAMIQPLNAIKMLKLQLSKIAQMVGAEPKLKSDQEFLRKLNNILGRIPLITTPLLQSEEKAELAEVALINEIAVMAKSLEVLKDTSEKYQLIKGPKY